MYNKAHLLIVASSTEVIHIWTCLASTPDSNDALRSIGTICWLNLLHQVHALLCCTTTIMKILRNQLVCNHRSLKERKTDLASARYKQITYVTNTYNTYIHIFSYTNGFTVDSMIKYHHFCEYVHKGMIKVEWIDTKNQLADIKKKTSRWIIQGFKKGIIGLVK